VNVGGTLDQTITVKNNGNANLVIWTITNPSSPFRKVSDNCSEQTIAPDETCIVTYRFAPTSIGSFSSNSNIPSNDPGGEKAVILNGTGLCPTPGTPASPSPVNGATRISTSPTLSWQATLDTDSYDVYFGGSSDPPKVGNVTANSYPLSGLNTNTVYHWRVVAKNNCGNSTAGTVWSFVTRSLGITPEEGTVGTAVTIKGDNFGNTKGTVFIGSAALKSTRWGNSEIQASLSKAISPGTYSVTVKPKTKSVLPITEADLFTVRGPEIDSVSPNSGAPGAIITLTGKFFGNKKGKVYLEYESKGVIKLKSCKVLAWGMEPKTGEGEVVFVVPKGLAPGTYPLKINNSVAEDIGEFTIVP